MAGTSAGMPIMGGHEPMPSGSVKIEVDGIGLAPLAPAPVSPQPAVSSVSEVQMSTADLFVQYHEYFQKLHLDMQVAQPPPTQPRAWTSARAPPTARACRSPLD